MTKETSRDMWNIIDSVTGEVLQTVAAISETEAVAVSAYTYPSVVARTVTR